MSNPKFKVWSKKAAENAADDQLFYRLISLESDDIILAIVDKKGKKIKSGNIMHIDQDLRAFIFLSNVNEKLKLRQDMLGHCETYTCKEMEEYAEFSKKRDKECMYKMSMHDISYEVRDKLKDAIMSAIRS